MASAKKYVRTSKATALSLAALLVLTGAMFLVTTLQEDSQEWVLVEDEVLEDGGIYSASANFGTEDDSPEYVFDFDAETSTYTFELTGGTRESSVKYSVYVLNPVEGFDYSKNYKFVLSSEHSYTNFGFYSLYDGGVSAEDQFNLKTVSSEEGIYTASVVLLDQLMTDFSYKSGAYVYCADTSASTTFEANTFSVQVYELQTDNEGSIAAAITGLVLIVFGIFMTPALNFFRRR